MWSWKRDLNTRPADYESAALPTELFQRLMHRESDAYRQSMEPYLLMRSAILEAAKLSGLMTTRYPQALIQPTISGTT